MLNILFQGIFDTDMTSVISISDFLLCVGCALIIGLILAGTYMYGTKYTKSFVATLALLPAVVCVVIMMVNGNVGTGVAVAGAFSLVRFRFRSGIGKRNWRSFSCHVFRTGIRDGISLLCIFVRSASWRNDAAVCPYGLWNRTKWPAL